MKIKKVVLNDVDAKQALDVIQNLILSVPQHTRQERMNKLYNCDNEVILYETEVSFIVYWSLSWQN